jgi:MFS family permease
MVPHLEHCVRPIIAKNRLFPRATSGLTMSSVSPDHVSRFKHKRRSMLIFKALNRHFFRRSSAGKTTCPALLVAALFSCTPRSRFSMSSFQRSFPPVRATGTGFSMSIGRVGAVMGPLVAGWLIAAGFQRPVIRGAGPPMLIAIACLCSLRALDVPEPLLKDGQPVIGAA